jgi:Cu/Ag efflux protein CusF
MNKIISFALFITLFSFFGISKVYATDVYLQCYEQCSDMQKKKMVRSNVYHNATPDELFSGKRVYKKAHVVNLITGEVNSYRAIIMPPEYDYDDVYVSVGEMSVSSDVKNKIEPARKAFRALKVAASKVTIPKSEIGDAWDFVNCAYCENNVNDFISSSLQGKIETVSVTVATVTQILGLTQTAIPNIYRVNLESGGYIEIKMTLLNTPVVMAIKVLKVVDNNNNTVPLKAEGLNNLRIQVATFQDIIGINNKIRDFNFGAPVRMGYVTISSCTPNPDYTGNPGESPCDP